MVYGLDLETECGNAACNDSQCSCALVPHLARITVIGIWAPTYSKVFRSITEFAEWYLKEKPIFRCHGGKFDFKMARFHGVPLKLTDLEDDSCLMGVSSFEKVSAEFAAWYEEKRKELNKARRVKSHREAGVHSLKMMMPYFGKVEPFWEPEDHNNDEYVLLDARYAYELCDIKRPMLEAQGTYRFYKEKLLPWQLMYLAAEERGVTLDLPGIAAAEADCVKRAEEIRKELDRLWSPAVPAYQTVARQKLSQKYKNQATIEKHLPTSINYDSPAQLKWLLKDYLRLDITTLEGKESTDKEVLERLAASGRKDIELFLEYREKYKLAHTYFPSYRELSHNGVIRASFNLDVTKTGRTSSNAPNLQNQPKEMQEFFMARPGYVFVYRDLSSIEPCLAAYYSEEPKLVELVQQNKSFHAVNCNAIFSQDWDISRIKHERKREYALSKMIGLSVLYGAGFRRVMIGAQKSGFSFTEKQCREIVDRLRNTWPKVTEFKEWLDAEAERGPIFNLFGRARDFRRDLDSVYLQNFNGLIQSSASDLLVYSVHRAVREFQQKQIDAHFILSVHDSALFEVPQELESVCTEIIERNMTDYRLETKYGLVPIRCEGGSGERWRG